MTLYFVAINICTPLYCFPGMVSFLGCYYLSGTTLICEVLFGLVFIGFSISFMVLYYYRD